ncbi:MAG: 16S rRNA (cytidine(1402)-2'-O)-methyltransferase [Patescibacteria group bacterium]|nr:16S rRNA (cytidine(1402)-2'-O)-methyltransferase [Patescibacteria group bacterium]
MSILYLVATPIGNLEDITLRALKVLKEVDFILCEDTRKTKILLDRYQIKKPLISYHQHSRLKKIDDIIALLKQGKNLALVSEAGTPGIADPGNLLIQEVVKKLGERVKIVPIPGPCALVTALSISGLPSDKFVFLGFPPSKKKREKFFKKLTTYEETIVLYESVYRLFKTLADLKNHCGEREIVIARELTKKFETIYRGTISQVTEKIKNDKIKGEFVIVIKNLKS